MAGRWLCLAASVVSFLGAVSVSEVVPGRATGVDLQPNIDGLSLDEVFLALTDAPVGQRGNGARGDRGQCNAKGGSTIE